MAIEPARQALERSAGQILLGHHAQLVARRHRGRVQHVEVRAPVMSAGPRQRGPPENGFHALRGGEGADIQHTAIPPHQRALAAKFGVPDGELAVEVPKTGEGDQVDAVGCRRGPKCQKSRHHLPVQCAGRVRDLGEMAAGASRQLIQREFRVPRHGPGSYPRPASAFLRT